MANKAWRPNFYPTSQQLSDHSQSGVWGPPQKPPAANNTKWVSGLPRPNFLCVAKSKAVLGRRVRGHLLHETLTSTEDVTGHHSRSNL